MTRHSVAENGGFCRKMAGVGWRDMADFVAVWRGEWGVVKRMVMELSRSKLQDAAAHVLMAFLPVLCVLCGKVFVCGCGLVWRKMADFVAVWRGECPLY